MNEPASHPTWVAFEHHRLLARGPAAEVIATLKHLLDERPDALPVVLDAQSSERIERDWREPLAHLLAQAETPAMVTTVSAANSPAEAPRGPGRPRLGVTAREVTLLPRHWDWLASQPGGASVALRKLVQAAMRDDAATDARRRATDAAYRFMATVCGDLPHFEALSRALFAGDLPGMGAQLAQWPADVAQHLQTLTAAIEAAAPTN